MASFSRGPLFGVKVFGGPGHILSGHARFATRVLPLLVVPPGNHLRRDKGWAHRISPPRLSFVTRKTLD
jgi:hypothetical protein